MSYLCPKHRVSALTHHRYDLDSTFDVLVGSKTFSLYTAVFTERSEFFRAARKPEWLAGDPKKPVDLKDEDSELFNTYINCVYFGKEVLKLHSVECTSGTESGGTDKVQLGFRSLIQIYLLADKLQDLATANMAIDEIISFSDAVWTVPLPDECSHVYSHTPRNSPLRVLMRDYCIYENNPSILASMVNEFPRDLVNDIMLEVLRIKTMDKNKTVAKAFEKELTAFTREDRCHYHQHDDKHPRCVPKPKRD